MSEPTVEPAAGLVTYETYVRVTGDRTAEPTAALDEALNLVQDEIDRTLPHGTYTETLAVYPNGLCYPSAAPIESVAGPNVANVSIQGAGVYLGYFNPAPVLNAGDWNASIPPQVTLTYTGGYTAQTLPAKLARAICRVAYNILHPAALPNVPAGATNVHVGDVGFSSATALRAFDPVDDGVRRDLRGYRRPHGRGWQQ